MRGAPKMNELYPHVDISMIRRLAGERDFSKFFELAATEAARAVQADGAALIQHAGDNRLQYRFFQGLPADYQKLASSFTFSSESGTAGVALRTGSPIFTQNYKESPYAIPEFIETGIQANFVIPIGPEDDRRAVMAIAWFKSKPIQPPNATQLAIVQLLSDLIYAALYRQSLEENLAQQAQHDALTGLPNRRYLLDHLGKILNQSPENRDHMAVAILDLDGFKPVNDTYGHAAGDQVLKQLAARMVTVARDVDFIARLGGDEFAFVFGSVQGKACLENLLDRICAILEKPYILSDGNSVECPSSLGVILVPEHETDAETLLRHADRAMYVAKGRKKIIDTPWEIFKSESLSHASRSSQDLGALFSSQLELHYQPVFDISRKCVVRLEALARLRDGDRLTMPSNFIPSLNQRQRRKLFDAVLEGVLNQVQKWKIENDCITSISINVEPLTLVDSQLPQRIYNGLNLYDVEPHQITLEILEQGEFLSQKAAIRQLTELRAMGIRLAIDDLGAAYSSLLRLRNFPIDEVKLDQAFVRELSSNLKDIAFVLSVRELARGLAVDLVAEGAETPEVINILQALGINQIQGYGIAMPQQPSDVPNLLHQLNSWDNPPQKNIFAVAYTKHLTMDSNIIGLLLSSPRHLNAETLSGQISSALGGILACIPEAFSLYRKQLVLLHDMARHHDTDLRLPIKRYQELGSQLRHVLHEAARME